VLDAITAWSRLAPDCRPATRGYPQPRTRTARSYLPLRQANTRTSLPGRHGFVVAGIQPTGQPPGCKMRAYLLTTTATMALLAALSAPAQTQVKTWGWRADRGERCGHQQRRRHRAGHNQRYGKKPHPRSIGRHRRNGGHLPRKRCSGSQKTTSALPSGPKNAQSARHKAQRKFSQKLTSTRPRVSAGHSTKDSRKGDARLQFNPYTSEWHYPRQYKQIRLDSKQPVSALAWACGCSHASYFMRCLATLGFSTRGNCDCPFPSFCSPISGHSTSVPPLDGRGHAPRRSYELGDERAQLSARDLAGLAGHRARVGPLLDGGQNVPRNIQRHVFGAHLVECAHHAGGSRSGSPHDGWRANTLPSIAT
jgi:hypothetical protein